MAKRYISYTDLPLTGQFKPGGTLGDHHAFVATAEDGRKSVRGVLTGGGFGGVAEVEPGGTLGYDCGSVWRVRPPHEYRCPVRRWLAEHRLPQHLISRGSPRLEIGVRWETDYASGHVSGSEYIHAVSFGTRREAEQVLCWLEAWSSSRTPVKEELEDGSWRVIPPPHPSEKTFSPENPHGDPGENEGEYSPAWLTGHDALTRAKKIGINPIAELIWGSRRPESKAANFAAIWIEDRTAAEKAFEDFSGWGFVPSLTEMCEEVSRGNSPRHGLPIYDFLVSATGITGR